MQTKNSSKSATEETKSIYQQLVTIHQLYKAHFVEIRMGAQKGRRWTLQAFQKALDGAGLKSELIGENEGDPREPRKGDYLLLVEGEFVIDIAHNRQLRSISFKCGSRVPHGLAGNIYILFNFGSHEPEYRSPYDERSDVDDYPDSWLNEKDKLSFLLHANDDDSDYSVDENA